MLTSDDIVFVVALALAFSTFWRPNPKKQCCCCRSLLGFTALALAAFFTAGADIGALVGRALRPAGERADSSRCARLGGCISGLVLLRLSSSASVGASAQGNSVWQIECVANATTVSATMSIKEWLRVEGSSM